MFTSDPSFQFSRQFIRKKKMNSILRRRCFYVEVIVRLVFPTRDVISQVPSAEQSFKTQNKLRQKFRISLRTRLTQLSPLMNSLFFISNKNAYAKRIISKLRPCPPTLIFNQNKSWIRRMATTRRIKPKRQIDIQYNSSKTQIRKQLKIGFFGTPYIYRESIKDP